MADIAKNTPNKHPFPKDLPKNPVKTALAIKENNPFYQENIKMSLKDQVFVRQIPWNDIPESLQQILIIQYDSANLDESKEVNLTIGDRGMIFILASSHSHDFIDRQGEYYSPGLGFRIRNTNIDTILNLSGRKPINAGDFIIYKGKLSKEIKHNSILEKLQRGEDLTEDETEFFRQAMNEKAEGREEGIEIIQSRLIHLQDITRLLEANKKRAFIYTD